MSNPIHIRSLIMRGLLSIKDIHSLQERALYLEAAADLLILPVLLSQRDEQLSEECRVTAACLRTAEETQMRLFDSIGPFPSAP